MPAHTRYVGRPTKYGNPFAVGAPLEFPYKDLGGDLGGEVVRDLAHAVALFEVHVRIASGVDVWIRHTLAGWNLACWCKPGDPCHGDVLLRIANTPEGVTP